MIGNDVVDLKLAETQSNWRRKGFLDKVFTLSEQNLILNFENQTNVVWNLWTRKEAAYKIYNRLTFERLFNPLEFKCKFNSHNSGSVKIDNYIFYTETLITENYIYSIASLKQEYFDKIINIDSNKKIYKKNGIPFLIDSKTKKEIPISITHHGEYQFTIGLII